MAGTAATRMAQPKANLRPSASVAGGKPLNERESARDKTSEPQELDTLRREHNKLQQAIYEAAQVQRTLCAPRELLWGDFQIAGELFPLRHLSGDFFKVTELESSLGIIVGDIAGKGLTAGIWHAHLLAISQRCARSNSADPAAAVAAMNRELWQDQSEPPLTALFFATLDPQTNELAYCNAGLPAPLVLREGKAPERLDEGGPMLGAIQGATYKFAKTRMHPGDMLIAYSDGVTECCNHRDEEFGNDRLLATANAVRGSSANLALFSILATVLDFADVCSASDDLSLLVVRRREAPAPPLNQPARKTDFSADRRPPSHAKPKNAARRGNSSRQLN